MEANSDMQTVGAYEAKTKFSSILNKVINGEDITITLHGVPVVDMRRHNEQNAGGIEAAIAEIMEQRKEFAGTFEGENIKALIEEGRR
jgi:antitoxin (DNA-binding transcriptional repressor) of toxin-antitoxin stability system